jgi:signal transduction histidine kinase
MTLVRRFGRRAKSPVDTSDGEPGGVERGDRSKAFEAMLAGISRRLVQAPLGGMDAAINDALAAVSTFAGVERSHVFVFDEDRATMNEIARWPLPDGTDEDALRSVGANQLPFYAQEVFSGRDVVFSDVSEIPQLQAADLEFLAEMGARSGFTMPLIAAGETIGTLTLTTRSYRRTWSDDDVAMLQVAADIVAPALTRRRSEREQQEAISFEHLITSLVSEFMNLPAEELDSGMERALETIARFVDCDRSAFFILDESGDFGVLDRGWWAPEATPVVDDFDRIGTAPGTLYGDWMRSGAPHLILNAAAIEAIRPDAVEAIREKRLGTIANFPLVIGDRRIGWFGVGAKLPRVSWSAAELRSLGLAANALANMYTRRQSERDRRRHQRFEDTLSDLAADFIKRPLAEIRTGIVEIVDRFGRFAGSDRAAVLLIDEKDRTAYTYHEWIARGDPAPIRDFPVSAAPAFFEQLMTAGGPWFMYVEDFPPSDELAASALEAIGIRTLLNCPVADGDHVYGYASIGYPKSRHRPIAGAEQVLAFAASIIANALSRERLEHQASEHREALSRALRLGSLGQLATGIAHELNQPLTAIVNYSRAGVRWLATADFDRAALAGILDRVSEEAIRAGDIIHNLRNHVKGGARDRRASSIREIVEKACSLLAGTARDHDVAIVTQYEGSLPFVHAEPTEIEQVVINVVQNAIDSIAAAGMASGEVRVLSRRNRACVEVEIIDTGPGFGAGDPRKVFDQFYTTKPGGLGLGLSISRALIESNGGTMDVIASSRGGIIRFTLPVAGAGRGRAGRKSKPAPAASPRA